MIGRHFIRKLVSTHESIFCSRSLPGMSINLVEK